MPKSFTKKIFPLLTVLLLAPWPVAYAHDYNNGTIGQDNAIRIEVAGPSVTPTWTAFPRTIGGVTTPGDLFYLDASQNAADITVNLYITNTHKLSHCYRYLILKVGVYSESKASVWEKAYQANGEPITDVFITLSDARVGLRLSGYTKYKITIDNGSFYCTTTNSGSGSLEPQFYLKAG